ncbi:MAG: hypothetical protein ACJ75S_06925 [Solirubrobacterales bacterium]|jgi:hypothetical protein
MASDDDTERVTVHDGCKQLMLDGEHLADVASPEAARVIAICLNRAGLPPERWPHNERVIVADFFA